MEQLHQQQPQPLQRAHQRKPHRLRNSLGVLVALTAIVEGASFLRYNSLTEWDCKVSEVNSLGTIIDATQVGGDGFVSYFRMSDERLPDIIASVNVPTGTAKKIARSCYAKLLPQIEAAVDNYCSAYNIDNSI